RLLPVEPFALGKHGRLALRHQLEDVDRHASRTQDVVVEHAHAAARDRPDRELGLGGQPELPHDEDVERRTEHLRDRGRNRHAAAGPPEDQGVGEPGQRRRETPAGIPPIGERRRSTGQATTRYTWNTSAYSRLTLMPCVLATFQTYSAFA